MTLNTAYCRHLRLAGQHHPRPSQWQVFRLDREARGLWSGDRPDRRNDPAAEAARGSARGSQPEESNADPRSVSAKSM